MPRTPMTADDGSDRICHENLFAVLADTPNKERETGLDEARVGVLALRVSSEAVE